MEKDGYKLRASDFIPFTTWGEYQNRNEKKDTIEYKLREVAVNTYHGTCFIIVSGGITIGIISLVDKLLE